MVPVIDFSLIDQALAMLLLVGATGAPYSTGIFETIVAVHFGGGLAVEFFDHPESHLQLSKGIPNFSKAVISLWFRVPRKSLETVWDVQNQWFADHAGEEFPVPPRLLGVLPLMTMGELKKGYQIDHEFPVTSYTGRAARWSFGAWIVGAPHVFTQVPAGTTFFKTSTRLVNPSYVGIVTTGGADDKKYHLEIRLNTKEFGSGVWMDTQLSVTYSNFVSAFFTNPFGLDPTIPPTDLAWGNSGFGPYCKSDVAYPGGEWTVTETFADVTGLFTRQLGTEYFRAGVYSVQIVPDHWHHALISVDLEHASVGEGWVAITDTPDCSVEGETDFDNAVIFQQMLKKVTDPCKVYIALDDVHYTKTDRNRIDAAVSEANGLGDNDMVSFNVGAAVLKFLGANIHEKAWSSDGLIEILGTDTDGYSVPTYTHKVSKVPSGGFPLGLPSTSSLGDNIYNIEMAELQVFTNVALDTSEETNRRLFITDKGKPELDYTAVDRVLGKPVIRLHKSSNWIKGKNTGSAGKFGPLGEIDAYKPDPSLHGPQNPSELAK